MRAEGGEGGGGGGVADAGMRGGEADAKEEGVKLMEDGGWVWGLRGRKGVSIKGAGLRAVFARSVQAAMGGGASGCHHR